MALPGSVCEQPFVDVTIGLLDVKSLVHDGEGYKFYRFRDILSCNVLRICNIQAIPTYSTDSMIESDVVIQICKVGLKYILNLHMPNTVHTILI